MAPCIDLLYGHKLGIFMRNIGASEMEWQELLNLLVSDYLLHEPDIAKTWVHYLKDKTERVGIDSEVRL
jgi:hypothetical protein